MRAASRAQGGLLVGLGLLVSLTVVSPAIAQPTDPTGAPRCPAVVADQPLSVSTPFSATLRPRAGDDGRIESTSLLCAYGEGVAPAAEVTVTWGAGPTPCARADVAVASGLDAQAFDELAGSLAATAGEDCPASGGGRPIGVVAGGILAGGAVAVVALRRRRTRRGAALVGETAAGPVPLSALPAAPAAPDRVPDAAPVLAALRGPGGRDFARTGAGQLAVVAAAAYLGRDSVSGDLARAASLAALPVGLRPRAEVAALVAARAHHDRAADR